MNTNDKVRRSAELVEEGIAALKVGRKAHARLLLGQALRADPYSEKGWLWLSGAVDTDEERRYCLTQVLAINGKNAAAQNGLTGLGPGPAFSPFELPITTPEPAPPAAEAPVWSRLRDQAPEEAAPEPAPPAAEAPVWSEWRDQAPEEAAPEPAPPAAKAPVWSQWRDQAPEEAAPEPAPPAAEAPVWSQWRDQAPEEAVPEPVLPAAEAPAWSRWRDQAAATEAVEVPEVPVAEASVDLRLRQEATAAARLRPPVPKVWLIMTVILTACFLVGLALLLAVSFGVLGK